MDLVDLYDRGSAWTAAKIPAATGKLDEQTPCEQWKVRDLLNHLMAAHEIFEKGAKGEQVGPPSGMPPELIGDDPAEQFEQGRQRVLSAFKDSSAAETNPFIVGIAFADMLTHGWDLAKATGQDATMPEDLAQAAMQILDGQLPPERRGDAFKPAIEVGADASTQDRFVGYLGRQP